MRLARVERHRAGDHGTRQIAAPDERVDQSLGDPQRGKRALLVDQDAGNERDRTWLVVARACAGDREPERASERLKCPTLPMFPEPIENLASQVGALSASGKASAEHTLP